MDYQLRTGYSIEGSRTGILRSPRIKAGNQMKTSLLAPYLHALQAGSTLRWKGRVNQVVGNLIESEGPFGFVGESCEIMGAGDKTYAAEIVGFRGTTILSMTADQPQGIRLGDQIVAWGARPSIRVGAGLLG